MGTRIKLGEITAEVTLKNIKNVHLSVYPPDGRVRISAPARMSLATLRVFALSKLGWIRQQQRKLREQARETPREYIERESHYVWGRRYLLQVVESGPPVGVALTASRLRLRLSTGMGRAKRRALVEAWYRDQLKRAVPPLIAKWAPLIGVQADRFFVQRMKTRWGSCNPRARTIRLNTELAKKPPQCLEYVVVHELAHLLEPTHNANFVALMDRFLPGWRVLRDELNRAPLSHEDWEY